MQKFELENFTRGWFVGDFSPSILSSKDCEVGIKHYKKGYCEERHFHKIATEITAVIKGRVQMNGVIYKQGDIILIKPNESTDFKALEESITCVVKMPSVKDDKFLGEAK